MQEERMPWPEWRIIKRLGSGGFGRVYEIERDDGFGHAEKAAMKVIPIPKEESDIDSMRAEGYTDMEISEGYRRSLEQVMREYTLMSELKGHPNIVACEDRATRRQDNGIGWNVYIRMELLKPFVSEARERSYDAGETVRLGKDLCRAVMACHENNIMHRDIKPENVFVTSFGDYKLGDFGIARTMEHTTRATVTGTPDYMAPEVCREEPYGKEADIYSLGMVMYWLMNGRRLPFVPTDHVPSAEERLKAYRRRISGEKIKEPREGDGELKRIILKAVSYKPGDRYQSADEMLADLEKWEKANDSLSSTKGKYWVTDNLTGGDKDKDSTGDDSLNGSSTMGDKWNGDSTEGKEDDTYQPPRGSYKEFALQGGNRKPARADKPGKQLVFMAFSAQVNKVPVRYMYYELNRLERDHILNQYNSKEHPNEYFGERHIYLKDFDQETLEVAVQSFIEDSKSLCEGGIILKKAYFEAHYSNGEHIVIDNFRTKKILATTRSPRDIKIEENRKKTQSKLIINRFYNNIEDIFEKNLTDAHKNTTKSTLIEDNVTNNRRSNIREEKKESILPVLLIILILYIIVLCM